jgi:predicted dienelactone hydrolase
LIVRRILLMGVVAFMGCVPFAAGASYHVGLTRLSFTDPAVNKVVQVVMWYPTLAAERDFSIGPFPMHAAQDAAVADGKFGLILFSHGTGGSPLLNRDTAEALARAGFLVAAVQHPGDNTEDPSATRSGSIYIDRPRQLHMTIDQVAQDPRFATHLNFARIGALGHSRGGYSVIALVTGQADIGLNRTHCLAHPDDTGYCGLPRSGPPRPDSEFPVLTAAPDTRVKALVLLAPQTIPFSPEVLGRVHLPIRLYAAEKDELVPPRYHADAFRKALGRPPQYTLVPNAGHFAFVAPFPESVRTLAGAAAIDPLGFDRVGFHRKMNAEIVGFFKHVLQ